MGKAKGAFCLEAQTEPNCINHGIGFYEAGEVYKQITVYEILKKINSFHHLLCKRSPSLEDGGNVQAGHRL